MSSIINLTESLMDTVNLITLSGGKVPHYIVYAEEKE